MQKRILVVMAHPDDESFGLGSLIAKYTAEGVEVSLICTTNGDVGTVDDKYMVGYNSIAEMRLAELDCAAKVLGFKEVVLFGYRDSGMMGSAENQHAQCLWQAPLDTVTERIVEVIRRIKPQVIITFDPYGGYGHPDHIKTNQATIAAYKATQLDPEHPQKVYYNSIPRTMVRIGLIVMRLMRKDPRKFGRNGDMDMQAVYDNLQPITAKINVAKYAEIGAQASACHASQGGGEQTSGLIGFVMRFLTTTMPMTRAYPVFQAGTPTEHDLFEGLG